MPAPETVPAGRPIPGPGSRPTAPDPFLLGQLRAETEAKAEAASAVACTAAGAPSALLTAIAAAIDELGTTLVDASHDLAANPEVGFQEHRSAGALADIVAGQDIAVQRGAYGLPTALRAEIGDRGGPTMALCSEYDALPGIGHACGHNIIATAGLGAFLALAQVRDRLPGRIVWLGTPAEEGGGGKELMARAGAFDDVDAALMIHPFTYDLAEPVFLGRRDLRVTFTGVAAHAAAQPFMGRNALDAVNLTYTGVALQRQQMPPSDRIHCVITDGGERPNIIPERAELLFYLRSEYVAGLRILCDRVTEIVRGAALMTGCGVQWAWDESPAYLPIRTSGPLAASWVRRYGDRGHRVLPAGILPRQFAGSTDFGNVSLRVPAVHAMVKITEEDLSLHTREFAAAAITPAADRVISDAAYGMAAVTADYLSDAELQAEVAAEFQRAGGAVDVPTYFDLGTENV